MTIPNANAPAPTHVIERTFDASTLGARSVWASPLAATRRTNVARKKSARAGAPGANEEHAYDDQHRGDHERRVLAERRRESRGQRPTGWATQLRKSCGFSTKRWESNSGTAHATRRT